MKISCDSDAAVEEVYCSSEAITSLVTQYNLKGLLPDMHLLHAPDEHAQQLLAVWNRKHTPALPPVPAKLPEMLPMGSTPSFAT